MQLEYANTLINQGKLLKAEAVQREAVKCLEKTLGEGAEKTLMAKDVHSKLL